MTVPKRTNSNNAAPTDSENSSDSKEGDPPTHGMVTGSAISVGKIRSWIGFKSDGRVEPLNLGISLVTVAGAAGLVAGLIAIVRGAIEAVVCLAILSGLALICGTLIALVGFFQPQWPKR